MTRSPDLRQVLDRFAEEATTANAVHAALRHCIVEGILRPGERLLSDDLATRLGVSRTPVREALRKLEAEGHVAHGQGKGLVVRTFSDRDLDEVFFVRELLECAASRLAAENAAPAEIARMGELIEDLEIAATRDDADLFRALSGQFHLSVHEAGRNRRLAEMLATLQDNVRRFSGSTLYASGRLAEALGEHRALYQAIRDRDGDRAEALTREHRRRTLAMRRQMIRQRNLGERNDG
jgi:DNA-binding GntR family transcriptional regulator